MFYNILAASMSQGDLEKIVKPILDICDTLVPVLLAVVGSIGAIYCILLGVKYARADEPQEHDKTKKALKNAIVGFVLIFVLLAMLQVGLSVFEKWWPTYVGA
jgi:hypothetical protein